MESSSIVRARRWKLGRWTFPGGDLSLPFGFLIQIGRTLTSLHSNIPDCLNPVKHIAWVILSSQFVCLQDKSRISNLAANTFGMTKPSRGISYSYWSCIIVSFGIWYGSCYGYSFSSRRAENTLTLRSPIETFISWHAIYHIREMRRMPYFFNTIMKIIVCCSNANALLRSINEIVF